VRRSTIDKCIQVYNDVIMFDSIHILLRAPGLHMNAAIRLEGLSELLALVQRYRVEEVTPGERVSGLGVGGFRLSGLGRLRRRTISDGEPVVLSEEGVAIRSRFQAVAWEGMKSLLPGKTFGMKLLLVAAWLEAQRGQPVFKGEVRVHFARTGEPFPANPGRDTRALIDEGLILKTSDRQHLSVSDAGWREVGRWLDAGDGGSGEAGVPA
jgi:hypothetical protein